ncbi:Tetratricopeptide repeat-containing protein [Reichenbachiella agariperforans]|uniref:Tetratricopeptide repeat-containing protein n=1 Tax=Reichenbachiella agariperforans TaxID=156994 RepID=A0A1M6RRT1_REIAG|nr:tetratricopeptide repeat protein [Reichenbachiella agariperforans]SHK35058.1 Tetratricopeptide repeat-containing protein [Reichenbachiella agariperforans]
MTIKLLIITVLSTTLSISDQRTTQDSIRAVLDSQSAHERLATLVDLCNHGISDREGAQRTLNYSREGKQLARKLGQTKDLYWIQIEEASAIGLIHSRQQSIDSLNQIIPKIRKVRDNRLLIHALIITGVQMTKLDQMTSAREPLLEAVALAVSVHDSSSLAKAYNNLGNVSNHLGLNQEAIDFYLNALTIKEAMGTKNLSTTYNNVAQIFKNMGNYEEAIRFNQKAMLQQQASGNTFGLSISHLNLGNIFSKQKKYDSALFHNERALSLSQSIADTVGFAFAYYNLASVYFSLDDYPRSLDYYEKALPIFSASGMRTNVAQSQVSISINSRLMGDFDKAKTTLDQANTIAAELNSFVLKKSIAESYYELYKATGDYRQALNYHEEFKANADSILNATQVQEISSLQKNYEIANRDNRIAVLDKENEITALNLARQNTFRNGLLAALALFSHLSTRTMESLSLQKTSGTKARNSKRRTRKTQCCQK